MALHLNNNTYPSLASYLCENSFVLKHDCEAKDMLSIVIQIWRHKCKDSISLQSSRHFFNQSEVKPNSWLVRTRFPELDWFTVLSVYFVIG